MTTVQSLEPGDVVYGPLGVVSATFISATKHPIYPGLQLVTWRMSDGSWSHDALRADQEVGDPEPTDPAQRQVALRNALLGNAGGARDGRD